MRIQLLLSILAIAVLAGCTKDAAAPHPTRPASVGHVVEIGMSHEKAKKIASAYGFEPEPYIGAYEPTKQQHSAFEIRLPDDRALTVWHAKGGDTVTAIRLTEHATQPKNYQQTHHLTRYDFGYVTPEQDK